MNQYLAVTVGDKHMAGGQQFVPQLAVIINLPVKHQHQGLVLVVQRLVGRLNVDNAQTAKAHGNAVVQIIPFRIRPPMGDEPAISLI